MQPDYNQLGRLATLIETERMQRRITTAQDVIRQALHHCPDLSISMSGGKDSVAAGIIARSVAPAMPIVTADPPNPLPYREAHMVDLRAWFGGPWRRVRYDWPVERVLDGLAAYPANLKVRTLTALRLPGFVLGLRNAESAVRQINWRKHGSVYRTSTGWRALPIAHWTAEEALALAIYFGAPVAEVYRKPLLGMRLDQVRDGTWWPHRVDQNAEDWMRRNWPAEYPLWLRATELPRAGVQIVF